MALAENGIVFVAQKSNEGKKNVKKDNQEEKKKFWSNNKSLILMGQPGSF